MLSTIGTMNCQSLEAMQIIHYTPRERPSELPCVASPDFGILRSLSIDCHDVYSHSRTVKDHTALFLDCFAAHAEPYCPSVEVLQRGQFRRSSNIDLPDLGWLRELARRSDATRGAFFYTLNWAWVLITRLKINEEFAKSLYAMLLLYTSL